jgi:MFS family permease
MQFSHLTKASAITPARVLVPVGIGTCLSLLGDVSLYAVLPTHTAVAGVSIASVGALLSVNRFIRLIFNGPGGLIYDRSRRRHLFVPALFLGAFSTAIYGLTHGFWPLLIGRLLWGLSWVGIWIGGNTIVLDVTRADTRGRWVGFHQVSFFLGAASGSLLGGFLTDTLGYHQAMITNACLTLLGAIIALLFLPETRGLRLETKSTPSTTTLSTGNLDPSTAALSDTSSGASNSTGKIVLFAAIALYAAQRIARAGVLQSTFGLFLLEQMGDRIQVGELSLGVATLTGLVLGISTLIAATSALVMGGLSDRVGNRWRVAAAGLVPGVLGFGLLSIGKPFTILSGVPLTAITGGSNQGLSTTLIGDLGTARQGRRLGILYTVGDFTSAIGPPLAYGLMPLIGIKSLYALIAALFVCMFFVMRVVDRQQLSH